MRVWLVALITGLAVAAFSFALAGESRAALACAIAATVLLVLYLLLPHGERLPIATRTARAYRRMRWRRLSGWSAASQGLTDGLVLIASGPYGISEAKWEIEGPDGLYHNDPTNPAKILALQSHFPTHFERSDGVRPKWDRCVHGRYWAILIGVRNGQRVRVCKVPFRIEALGARIWHPYERIFIRIWRRFFGGTPAGGQHVKPDTRADAP